MNVCSDSWALITEGKSIAFTTNKEGNKGFEYGTCLAWFYDSFYERLFSVYPSCAPYFKGDLQVQGKALVRMISTCLENMRAKDTFTSTLHQLAKSHAARGIVVNEYFVVGEVLIWTFDKCLGAQFDNDMKMVWLKIYSSMLTVIVPAAVVEEAKYAASNTATMKK